jgi:hypothetical protein
VASEEEARLQKKIDGLQAQLNALAVEVRRLYRVTTHPTARTYIEKLAVQLDQRGDLVGTANQVSVADGIDCMAKNTDVTLSTPQDIHTGATPSFYGIKLTGNSEIYGNYYIKWLNAPGGTTYCYIMAMPGTGVTISAVNVPFQIQYGAAGASIGVSLDSAGNWVFNYEAADADFSIRKHTAGTAYFYDAGADKHTFSGAVDFTGTVTGAGTGDVVGPATAVDDDLAAFNTTTGKLIKDSGKKVGDFILHSLATAVSDFLVASGTGAFVKKTLAEVKTILGLGSAAYTASSDYAVAAKGVTNGDSHDHNGGDGAQIDHGGLGGLSDDDHTQYTKHSLATATSDFLVASGAGAFIKKTLAEVKTLIGITDTANIDPGMKISKLWASDGDPQVVYTDAAGNMSVGKNTPAAQLEVANVVQVTGTAPDFTMLESDGPANEKYWNWNVSAGTLVGRVLNDVYAAPATWIQVDRTGVVIDLITWGGPVSGWCRTFSEQSAPSAPADSQVTIYAADAGGGKTKLMALFPTGAAQQIAIEP